VRLKRGAAATMHEWLGAAEYVASEGNAEIVLCERGIRTPSDGEYARYTLDVTAVEAVRRVVDLPVIVDPSHATGSAGLVPRAALAGIAAGADGLLIEVIQEQAERGAVLCDAAQGIRPAVLESIIKALPLVCEAGKLLLIEESGAVVEAPDGAA
jgi:3-deoxy-7-phosphoheptulonate synthase